MTTHNVSASHFQTYLQSILPPALHPFFVLSYPISKSRLHISSSFPISRTRLPVETLYDKGFNDIFISISCAIGFTLLREVTLRYVASTFARAWLEASYQYRRESGKLTKAERRKMEHTVTRFAEQSWSFLYCTVFWLIGVVSRFSRKWRLAKQTLDSRSYSRAYHTPSHPNRCGAHIPSFTSQLSQSSTISPSSAGGSTRST